MEILPFFMFAFSFSRLELSAEYLQIERKTNNFIENSDPEEFIALQYLRIRDQFQPDTETLHGLAMPHPDVESQP